MYEYLLSSRRFFVCTIAPLPFLYPSGKRVRKWVEAARLHLHLRAHLHHVIQRCDINDAFGSGLQYSDKDAHNHLCTPIILYV